jgi:hypothetical protein
MTKREVPTGQSPLITLPTGRGEAVTELKATFEALAADVNAAVAFARAEDTQFSKRTLIRTFAAFVEGIVNQLSVVSVASAPLESGVFSLVEISALTERSFDVNEKGEVQERPAKISLKRRLRLAFRCYPRIHGAEFELDIGATGWSDLCCAILIRNRITHPTSVHSLALSDEDMGRIGSASSWFQDQLLALLRSCETADRKWVDAPAA